MKHANVWLGCSLLFALACGDSAVSGDKNKDTRVGHAVPAAWVRASQQALPKELGGVYIGMPITELKSVRVSAAPNQKSQEDPNFIIYGERMPNASRAMYFFDKHSLALVKVQVAEQLSGVQAIEPRIQLHSTRYGTATGIWDCPNQSGTHLATRRMSWTREPVGVEDVYLVVGQTVLATLYVAPSQLILGELKGAHCTPTPADRLTFFPTPTATSAQP